MSRISETLRAVRCRASQPAQNPRALPGLPVSTMIVRSPRTRNALATSERIEIT